MTIHTRDTRFTRTLSIAAIVAAAVSTPAMASYKHVAVAPAQMAEQAMVAPADKGLFSHSTMLPIYADSAVKGAAGGHAVFEQKVHLDGPMESPVVLLTPDAKKLDDDGHQS